MVITGVYYALGFGAGGAVAAWLAGPLYSVPMFLAAAFCLYFFRDPERKIPAGDVVVSPADGKVLAVVPEGPERLRISIFMNVFDVHVNRAPIAGRVTDIVYKRGRFLAANRDEAMAENEQNLVALEGGGSRVEYKQVAGLIARRIVCYKKTGDEVARGERVGLIKFGSRVDVFLGREWTVDVKAKERVRAGESVLAHKAG